MCQNVRAKSRRPNGVNDRIVETRNADRTMLFIILENALFKPWKFFLFRIVQYSGTHSRFYFFFALSQLTVILKM